MYQGSNSMSQTTITHQIPITPQTSHSIQQKLFKAGYKWSNAMKTYQDTTTGEFIHIWDDREITYGSFARGRPVVSIEEFLDENSTDKSHEVKEEPQSELEELREQIKKMQNCMNCKKRGSYAISYKCGDKSCYNGSKWELRDG